MKEITSNYEDLGKLFVSDGGYGLYQMLNERMDNLKSQLFLDGVSG